jgi:TonB family protein
MFNNLIESSSHISELKRRGSFFLFTVVTYAIFFVVAGVASIYAYDAHLDDPTTEIVTMLNPLDFAEPEGPRVAPAAGPTRGTSDSPNFVRRNPETSVNDPRIVPTTTSAAANPNPPLPPSAQVVIGDHDADPGIPGAGRSGSGGTGDNLGGRDPVIEIGTPPVPPPVHKTVPKVISRGVITGEAVSLPKPAYPPLAKQMGIQGKVSVQVLIDESGKVISAKAIDGSPALMHAAQRAAFEARFKPTRLSDQPVKVSGVITYNFVLQ